MSVALRRTLPHRLGTASCCQAPCTQARLDLKALGGLPQLWISVLMFGHERKGGTVGDRERGRGRGRDRERERERDRMRERERGGQRCVHVHTCTHVYMFTYMLLCLLICLCLYKYTCVYI